MSTTEEKVALLEREMNSHSTKHSKRFTFTTTQTFYLIGWALLNVAFVMFLLTFKPGFVYSENEHGESKVSIVKVIQIVILFAILTLIGLFVHYYCKHFD